MAKSLSYQKLLKLLRKHDKAFVEYTNKGKGGHRMIVHPNINGQKKSCPVPYHASKDISKGVLKSIQRAFDLPKDFFE